MCSENVNIPLWKMNCIYLHVLRLTTPTLRAGFRDWQLLSVIRTKGFLVQVPNNNCPRNLVFMTLVFPLSISLSLDTRAVFRLSLFKASEHGVRTVQDQAIIQTGMREVGSRSSGPYDFASLQLGLGEGGWMNSDSSSSHLWLTWIFSAC